MLWQSNMWKVYSSIGLLRPLQSVQFLTVAQDNSRFATYCQSSDFGARTTRLIAEAGPFCQISTVPSTLPQGLYDPPAYSPPPSPRPSFAALVHPSDSDTPPSYASLASTKPPQLDTKDSTSSSTPAPDVLHFLAPTDTLQSLSLAYKVPISVLRSTNNLFSDHLVAARRTVLIPGQYYKGGVSLSPRPVEGEEEEMRRGKIRKWMVGCKVAEYVPVHFQKWNNLEPSSFHNI